MSPHCSKTTNGSSRWNSVLTLLFAILSGCTFWETAPQRAGDTVARTQRLAQADELFTAGRLDEAYPLYLRLTETPSSAKGSMSGAAYDSVYGPALWKLALLYEKRDESEKALLALAELDRRGDAPVSETALRLARMKNHFRVGNDSEALNIARELDRDFKLGYVPLYDLAESLNLIAVPAHDHRLPAELKFLGEVQKYFIFVMESDLTPENADLTTRLIEDYDRFFAALANGLFSDAFKRGIAVSLLDQLRRFDRYRLEDPGPNPATISRFSAYSRDRQQTLTESFNQ